MLASRTQDFFGSQFIIMHMCDYFPATRQQTFCLLPANLASTEIKQETGHVQFPEQCFLL